MPVGLAMELVLRVALEVHVASVPIALLRDALCRPMRPDTKLRITKPLRHAPLLERIPCRLILPLRDLVRRRDARLRPKVSTERKSGSRQRALFQERTPGQIA